LIIAVNVLFFVVQQIFPVERAMGLIPAELAHHPKSHWITVITSMWLHAGLLHLGANMLFLWVFGNNIEDALGKFRFIVFYFVCGAAALLCQVFAAPGSTYLLMGSSGAIAGILGAYYTLYPRANVLSIAMPVFHIMEARAWIVLALWFVLEIFEGIAGCGMQKDGGVAFFALVGGFTAGLVVIQIMGGVNLANRQQQKNRYIYPPSDRGAMN
jgi:membrane associated rhomboid family serine protease